MNTYFSVYFFEILGLDISKEDTSKGYTVWPLIPDLCQYQL